jgi:hypothetical protein
VLAAVLLAAGQPGTAVPLDDVSFAIEAIAERTPPPTLRDCLDRLLGLGFLEYRAAEARYALPASGVGFILGEAFLDLDLVGVIQEALPS